MPNLRHLPLPPLPKEEEEGRDLYLDIRAEALACIRAQRVPLRVTA